MAEAVARISLGLMSDVHRDEGFLCPRCGSESVNLSEGYCGHCQDFTGSRVGKVHRGVRHLTGYQRGEIQRLRKQGWEFLRVERIDEQMATVDFRDPHGELRVLPIPFSKHVASRGRGQG
jgi:ribosomal protein L37E